MFKCVNEVLMFKCGSVTMWSVDVCVRQCVVVEWRVCDNVGMLV